MGVDADEAGRSAGRWVLPLASAALLVGVLADGGTVLWAQALAHLLTALAVVVAASDPSTPSPRRWVALLAGAVVLHGAISGRIFSAAPPFAHSVDRGLLNDLNAPAFFLIFSSRSFPSKLSSRVPWLSAGPLLLLSALPDLAFYAAGKGGRPQGLLLNPNVLAAGVLLTVPSAAALWRERSRAAGAILLSLGFLLLATSGSRAALGAAALGAAVFFVRSNRGKWLVAGLALAAAGAAVPFLDADRIGWGKSALAMAGVFSGVGPGAFGEAYPLYRAVPLGLNTLFAHNVVLEFLAERGLLGTLLYASLPGIALIRFLARADRAPLFQRASAAGMTAFLAHGFFHPGFSFPGLAWFFWAGAGVLCAGGDDRKPLSGAGRSVLVLLAAAAAIQSCRLFMGDEALLRGRDAAARGDGPALRAEVERGLRWNPREPELFSLRAALRVAEGNVEDARADLRRAVRLAPGGARFRAESGEAALLLGLREEAVRDYGEARRLMPLKKDYAHRWEELRAGSN